MKKIREFLGWCGKGNTDDDNNNDPNNNQGKEQPNLQNGQNNGQKKNKKIGTKITESGSTKSRSSFIEFSTRLQPMNGTPPNQTIYDVCAYVIFCEKDNKIALCVDQRSGFVWLPFVSLPTSKTWTDGAIDGAYIVLSGGDSNVYNKLKAKLSLNSSHCMQIFRLQLPQTQKFNIRLIYCVKLNANTSGYKCCEDKKNIKWYDRTAIINSKVEKVWGPEVREYCKLSTGPKVQQIEEYSLDQAFFYVPRDPPRNLEEELLRSTNYTEKDVERIYGDFIEHCFPAFYMTLTSFTDYMTKYGFERNTQTIRQLFMAFNFSNSGYLSFSEFLIGVTSIEPNAFNGQSRIKLVFKYFNVKRNGFLSKKEFEEMVRQIYPKESNKQIERRVDGFMKKIGTKKEGVAFDDFFRAVGSHKFRGTSNLCRCDRRIVTQISASMAARSLARSSQPSKQLAKGFKNLLSERQYNGICKSCREKKYDYALHLVKLDSEGRCVNPRLLPNWDQIERPNKSPDKKSTANKSPLHSGKSITSIGSDTSLSGSGVSSANLLNISLEQFSKDFVFNPKFAANFLINRIRDFNNTKGSHRDNKGVMDSLHERKEFMSNVEQLCREVGKIVEHEDRCVQISSPAYIIGDIHGNLEDLLTLERVLWKSIPIVSANYLFLGDYVDRGKWSVECCIYIMCMKLLAPTKVFILRGNHEVRDLQIHYTYKKECVRKYGDNFGSKIFEMTNRVFDKLAVSAVIDDAIYCAHGGIPRSCRAINDINKVKPDLRDPERESAVAWQILWSDPIGAQQFKETAELLQVKTEEAKGFLTNTKRGTAYLFGEDAVNTFLQSNGLTHIVRAHEVPAHGFQFHFGNKCTTIFSCSHYCGNDNEAACIHVDQQKLRIVRLDTKNNSPASD